ncbi:T9SS type A sorting domain-containing protein [Hymenobacter chitinivorans]|uniref:Putative secreted protein (Por secretion system target) n=1 Tax=Hymenobacter chitinivorans DSM 11115 TaxID=1121954 RepID=A0A2M9BMJ5_9BACT|nr:T9SS type A sorting domain-containing protein [Hymenobacter chitinivorans]PJJ59173.1 putative secreted protein (Por secretion system target) [Hymenobacter chitinivorans DSM 11115]
MKKISPLLLLLCTLSIVLPRQSWAQYQTPTLDGVITAGEYGDAQNQVANGITWYMTWDASYIYVAVEANKSTLPAVLFFDTDPALPATGSEGTLSGIQYTTGNMQATVTPPFQADRAFFLDNSKVEYYAAGSGLWSGATSVGATSTAPVAAPAIADLVTKVVGNASVRELRIARSALSLSAAGAFNWLGYNIYTPTGNLKITDGCVPITNEGGYLATATAARYAPYYYTVSNSGNGSAATKPFSQTSFMAPTAAQAGTSSIDLGSFSVYDFMLNSPGLTVRNAGSWTINGNMMVQQGTLDMNTSNANVVVKKNFTIGSGATFKHSTGNANLTVSGNMNVAGTFLPGTSRVTLDGPGSQQIASGTYYGLYIPGSGTKILAGDITILARLSLTAGVLETGASKVILAVSPTDPGNIALTETGPGYIRGTVQATGDVPGPNNYQFSGIGLTLAPSSGTLPLGVTTVTRYTGGYKTGGAFGTGNNALSQSALRQYKVEATEQEGIDFKLIFSYRDDNPSELTYGYVDNGTQKTYSMDENYLELFRTTDPNGGTWQNMHATTRDADLNKITVVRIRDFLKGNFFTLADMARPLPVSLVSFTAQALKGGVQLQWATATEDLSRGFTVERRAAAQPTWQSLKYLEAQGSASRGADYRYVDATAQPGTWYYRLRQTDRNDLETVLPVAVVTVREPGPGLQASPVPATRELTIDGLNPAYPVYVLDALGRTVLEHHPLGTSATLNVSPLPAGIYTVRTQQEQGAAALRFVKQ